VLVQYYVFDFYIGFLISDLFKEQFKCKICSAFLKYVSKQAAIIS
jgi:hypothetical protein